MRLTISYSAISMHRMKSQNHIHTIYRFIYISYTNCVSISTINMQKYIAVPQRTAHQRHLDSARTQGWRRHGWRVTVYIRSSQHSSSVSNDSSAHQENYHTHKTTYRVATSHSWQISSHNILTTLSVFNVQIKLGQRQWPLTTATVSHSWLRFP